MGMLNTMGSCCYCHFGCLVVVVYIFGSSTSYEFITSGNCIVTFIRIFCNVAGSINLQKDFFESHTEWQ